MGEEAPVSQRWSGQKLTPLSLRKPLNRASFFERGGVLPVYYVRPSFFLSLLVVTQIRGSQSGLFSPHTLYGSCLAIYRECISALSSLVDSRRIVRTYARRSQQLILLICI